MELTITEAVLWCLALGSGLVLASALLSRHLHRRSERRALARRVICRLCLHAFEDSSRGQVTPCPSCGALNEKPRRRD